MNRCLALLALTACVVASAKAMAREQEAAQKHVPLEPLLHEALRLQPGDVLDVELDDGEYEVEILRADGRIVEITFNARTGKLIEQDIEDD